MKILSLEKEFLESTKEDFEKYSHEEAQKAYELYQSGFIREMYFRGDQASAVLILESSNVEEANKKLKQLPFVKAGLITFELVPLIPYPGFSRLFKE